MTLKPPKKALLTALTSRNQHGENYILVGKANKSQPNVAVEVEKRPFMVAVVSLMWIPCWGKGEATLEEVCVSAG